VVTASIALGEYPTELPAELVVTELPKQSPSGAEASMTGVRASDLVGLF
jgi:hypothetical protein